jgi:HPt (histidine-containing phosphotransfer) domain-containing protein
LIETLSVVARTGNPSGIAQLAHALKSSSANVGALSLAATCAELELAASQNKIELVDGLVTRVLREHREVLRELEQKHLAA